MLGMMQMPRDSLAARMQTRGTFPMSGTLAVAEAPRSSKFSTKLRPALDGDKLQNTRLKLDALPRANASAAMDKTQHVASATSKLADRCQAQSVGSSCGVMKDKCKKNSKSKQSAPPALAIVPPNIDKPMSSRVSLLSRPVGVATRSSIGKRFRASLGALLRSRPRQRKVGKQRPSCVGIAPRPRCRKNFKQRSSIAVSCPFGAAIGGALVDDRLRSAVREALNIETGAVASGQHEDTNKEVVKSAALVVAGSVAKQSTRSFPGAQINDAKFHMHDFDASLMGDQPCVANTRPKLAGASSGIPASGGSGAAANARPKAVKPGLAKSAALVLVDGADVVVPQLTHGCPGASRAQGNLHAQGASSSLTGRKPRAAIEKPSSAGALATVVTSVLSDAVARDPLRPAKSKMVQGAALGAIKRTDTATTHSARVLPDKPMGHTTLHAQGVAASAIDKQPHATKANHQSGGVSVEMIIGKSSADVSADAKCSLVCPAGQETEVAAMIAPGEKRTRCGQTRASRRPLSEPRGPPLGLPLTASKLMEDNYEISDFEEDKDGNRVEPNRTGKLIPAWCAGFPQLVQSQASVDPDSIFGNRVPRCDLDLIFPDYFYQGRNPVKRRRGSSGRWFPDRLTRKEVTNYSSKMGYRSRWSVSKRQTVTLGSKTN